MKSLPRPSRQGDLDSLCGIYVLVNAVVYLYRGRIKRQRLKLALLTSYAEKWSILELIGAGMEDRCLRHLIKRVLQRGYYARYPIKFTHPFADAKSLRITGVLDHIHVYLKEAKKPHSRIVLLGTRDHWTLAYHVDQTYVYLFDSYGLGRVRRRSFALRAGRAAHVLVARETYFLERVEGGAA